MHIPLRDEYETEHAYLVGVWKLLNEKCKSLLSSKPDERDTPRVWALNGAAESFEDDSDFIQTHFADHRVLDMPPVFVQQATTTFSFVS